MNTTKTELLEELESIVNLAMMQNRNARTSELARDYENGLIKNIKHLIDRYRDSVVEELKKIEEEAWDDAEHYTCLRYAIDKVGKKVIGEDESLPIHNGIFGDSNMKPDFRNELRQQQRKALEDLKGKLKYTNPCRLN